MKKSSTNTNNNNNENKHKSSNSINQEILMKIKIVLNSLQTSFPQYKRIFFNFLSFSTFASPLQLNSTFNFVA